MVEAIQRPGRAVACSTGQTQLGEGVRWDARRSELLAVDILAGRVARGRVRDDDLIERVGVYQLPGTVGMVAPVQGDDGWVLGAGRGFVYLAFDGTHRTIAEVSPAGTRMNDGACDPQGRFWGGTLADDHHTGGARSTGWTRPDEPSLCSTASRSPTGSDGVPMAARCTWWTVVHGSSTRSRSTVIVALFPLGGSWSRCPKTSERRMA